MNYQQFLKEKSIILQPTGIEPPKLSAQLFDFQNDIVSWALRRVMDMQAIKRIIKEDPPWHVYIEKLTPMPKISGLGSFSMGHSEGFMLGLMTGFNLPYTMVRPNIWKSPAPAYSTRTIKNTISKPLFARNPNTVIRCHCFKLSPCNMQFTV